MKQSVGVQLVALTEGPNIPLDKPIILIGRHQECDIQIPSRKISRRHCCIAQVNDHLVVRDLGSTNGIRINGVKTTEGSLRPEDELMIGNMRYQLKVGDHERTQRADDAHAIKAARPQNGNRLDHQDSREEPMPLIDMSLSNSAPLGKPATQAAANPPVANPLPVDDLDQIELVPIDPPK